MPNFWSGVAQTLNLNPAVQSYANRIEQSRANDEQTQQQLLAQQQKADNEQRIQQQNSYISNILQQRGYTDVKYVPQVGQTPPDQPIQTGGLQGYQPYSKLSPIAQLMNKYTTTQVPDVRQVPLTTEQMKPLYQQLTPSARVAFNESNPDYFKTPKPIDVASKPYWDDSVGAWKYSMGHFDENGKWIAKSYHTYGRPPETTTTDFVPAKKVRGLEGVDDNLLVRRTITTSGGVKRVQYSEPFDITKKGSGGNELGDIGKEIDKDLQKIDESQSKVNAIPQLKSLGVINDGDVEYQYKNELNTNRATALAKIKSIMSYPQFKTLNDWYKQNWNSEIRSNNGIIIKRVGSDLNPKDFYSSLLKEYKSGNLDPANYQLGLKLGRGLYGIDLTKMYGVSTPQQNTQTSKFIEGQTYIDANGNKAIYKNGKFEEIK